MLFLYLQKMFTKAQYLKIGSLVLFLFFGGAPYVFSQIDAKKVDSLYRDDQFYVGFNYNLLNNAPASTSQYGLSGGLQFGFIRDMPFSKDRKWSLGIGIGYELDYLNHNIQIQKDSNGSTSYNILLLNNFDKNRWVTHTISLPVELRYRNSSPQKRKFFRFYPGFRFSRTISSKALFNFNGTQLSYSSDLGFAQWQYGPTLSIGYAQFNFNVYYGLNTLFTSEAINVGAPSDISRIKIGIIAYIL